MPTVAPQKNNPIPELKITVAFTVQSYSTFKTSSIFCGASSTALFHLYSAVSIVLE